MDPPLTEFRVLLQPPDRIRDGEGRFGCRTLGSVRLVLETSKLLSDPALQCSVHSVRYCSYVAGDGLHPPAICVKPYDCQAPLGSLI